jgi:hypothetical protein
MNGLRGQGSGETDQKLKYRTFIDIHPQPVVGMIVVIQIG